MPTFLVNAALAGWIKWVGFEPPAYTISVLLGCAVVYLLATSTTWIGHLIGPASTSASPLARLPPVLARMPAGPPCIQASKLSCRCRPHHCPAGMPAS